MKMGKKYVDSAKLIDKAKLYDPNEESTSFARLLRQSSMRPSRSTFVWVLTPVTLTSRFVVQ